MSQLDVELIYGYESEPVVGYSFVFASVRTGDIPKPFAPTNV